MIVSVASSNKKMPWFELVLFNSNHSIFQNKSSTSPPDLICPISHPRFRFSVSVQILLLYRCTPHPPENRLLHKIRTNRILFRFPRSSHKCTPVWSRVADRQNTVNDLIKTSKEKDTISIIMNGARTLPASVYPG